LTKTDAHPEDSGRTLSARLRESVRPFLAAGPLRRMYLATLVDAVGLGVYLTMSALYLTRSIGLTNWQTGLVLSTGGIASLVGLVPVGIMGDRWGARRVLVLLFAYRSLAFLGLLLAGNFATAVVAVVAAGMVSRVTGPVTQALVLGAVDTDAGGDSGGVEALAVVRALRNAGLALGATPAAAAVAVGTQNAYRAVLLVSVAAFALAALIVRRVPDQPVRRKEKNSRAGVARNGRFVVLTVVSGMLTLHALVLSIGFPLWLVQRTDAPRWLAALLLTVNTVLSVLLQVRLSRGVERLHISRRMMTISGLLLVVVCLGVPLTRGLDAPAAAALFLLLVVMLTLAELWQSAGSWGYTVALAPRDRRGSYLAFFTLGFTVVTIVGPTLITFMLDLGTLGWLVLAAWFLVATVITRTLPARLTREDRSAGHDAVVPEEES
jgi:MFS family permease